MKPENPTNIKKPNTWKLWTQKRYVLTMLVFLGYFNIYCLRANMSIAIVAMTQNRYEMLKNGTQISIGKEFDWDNVIQGYVLSSFFYGYITTQLLGGILATKYGGKLIFGAGVASTSVLTIISPWVAELSVYALIAARILMGVFEGVTFSSLYTMWPKWIPNEERGRVTSQAYSGSYCGAVFALMGLGYLSDAAGWRSIFWLSGGLGLLWFIAWLYFVTDVPDKNLGISQEELLYIQLSLEGTKASKTISDVQWIKIFSSKAVWGLNFLIFCETWGFYTLLTLLPKYFKDIFALDVSESGTLSALPYIAVSLMMQISGQIADKITNKNWLSVTNTRKAFVLVGFLSQTCFMLGASFWGEVTGTVFCLVAAVGIGSLAISTMGVNALDIAPNHSGIIFGIANTMGTLSGVMSPIVAGYVVSTEDPTADQWRIIFYITCAIYLFGAVFYLSVGSGVRQSWDYEKEHVNKSYVKNEVGNE